jgi:hypothetical protein
VTLHACPECGCLLTKARSGPDHRRLFALIHAAFHHWPEGGFQPRDAEHLRAYLLVKSGHFNAIGIPTPEGYAENEALRDLYRVAVESTAKAIDEVTGFHDYRVSASGIELLTPRSINWQTVGQKEFGRIRDAVEGLIETSLGVPVDQLLREKAA